jgi:hypothetical protein
MLSWIIQITIVSIILIFLVHYLINFFKSTLTVPKIKDLVNTPSIKYENMYNIIKNKDNVNNDIISNGIISNSNDKFVSNEDYTLIDLLPKQEENPSMKNELKNFLKKQLNNSNKQDNDISTLDSMNDINSFSKF